jgi:hypothetical protein
MWIGYALASDYPKAIERLVVMDADPRGGQCFTWGIPQTCQHLMKNGPARSKKGSELLRPFASVDITRPSGFPDDHSSDLSS